MKSKIRSLLFLTVLFLAACSTTSSEVAQLYGKEAPSTRFTLLDGTPLGLEELHGKTTVVLFWASWCAKSRSLIQALNKLAATYSSRKDVVFLAVSIDKAEDYNKLKYQIESLGLKNLRHAYSGNAELDEAYITFRGTVIPFFVIIDPKGTVVTGGSSAGVAENYLRNGKIS